MRTEARSSGVSSSTSTHDILPSAHCAAGSEMTPPSRGLFGVKARADADMLTQARVGCTARSAAAHDQRHTKDTLGGTNDTIAQHVPRRRRGVRGGRVRRKNADSYFLPDLRGLNSPRRPATALTS